MNINEYEVSTDKNRIEVVMIHDYLSNRSYWAQGIPFEVVKKSIENALCFGVYHQGKQVGFARVITDRATMAYLADVFIIESYRGRGLGKKLVKTIKDHPELQGLRLWLLATKDAHGLYRKQGFKSLTELSLLERFMVSRDLDAFAKVV